jgi:N-acetylmuramoyl-L-alanine amidase
VRITGFVFFFSLAISISAQNWNGLQQYQQTITRQKFCDLIDHTYNPSKTIYSYLNVTDDYVEIFGDVEKTTLDFTLNFAYPEETLRRPTESFRTIDEIRSLQKTKPLSGVRIVIDPGHIGGKWADMEERSVVWGTNPIIREGDKNLQIAKMIKARLIAAGAEVYVTHEEPEPVTSSRPQDFLEEARKYINDHHKITEPISEKERSKLQTLIDWRAQLYFYRRAEIAQRAENIRAHFMPDITICNHFNATEKSGARELTKDNRYAFFVNGCYGPDEVVESMTRFFLFSKLLEQSLETELIFSDVLTQKFLKIAKLPPVKYGNEKYQCRVNKNPYVYARNLAATRQYPGPCIILEPFYMNNPWTAERMAAGDYEGVKKIAGGVYPSLFREYADAVVDALIETYSRPPRNK